MQVAYQARDVQGQLRDGRVIAETLDEAARLLRRDGLFPLALEEEREGGIAAAAPIFRARVSRNDVAYLTSELAVMIDAGVPLAVALDSLERQTTHSSLKSVLAAIQRDVESGADLSSALERFPGHFNKTYVNLIRASEKSGTMAAMLDRIALQSRNEQETRQRVRGALAYPTVMLVLCAAVCIFLLTYVFPKLIPMFAARSIAIPAPTRVLMTLSNVLIHGWPWLIAGSVALIAGFWFIHRKTWFRSTVDAVALRLPMFGSLLRKLALARSMRTLSTTVNAGVPMIDAIHLGGAVSGNVHYERAWNAAAAEVATGKPLHFALGASPLFPPTMLQMIASGESSGRLGAVLMRISDYYEREVLNSVTATTRLLEPIMVLVMGSIIGAIALAMLLPIFKLSSHTG